MADMFRPVPIEQEPKRKNRFVLEFPTELGIDSFLVQTTGKPKLEIESTEIPYMNGSDWVAGRSKWGTIDVKFIDVIGPSTTQKVMEWVLHFSLHVVFWQPNLLWRLFFLQESRSLSSKMIRYPS